LKSNKAKRLMLHQKKIKKWATKHCHQSNWVCHARLGPPPIDEPAQLLIETMVHIGNATMSWRIISEVHETRTMQAEMTLLHTAISHTSRWIFFVTIFILIHLVLTEMIQVYI
jgi:hypothetical protein